MIKPTIGRIVWYYPAGKTQYDAGEQPHAAIISYVHSENCINISAFNQNGIQYAQTSIYLYQGDGERPETPYAEWMPYQVGQAKAAITAV